MFKPRALICLLLVSVANVLSAAEVLPDPTRPLEYKGEQKAQQSLQLNSILISEDRKVAIINGTQLQEKQWFGDKQVIQIKNNQVTLAHEGRKIVLTLHGKTIRRSR